jgi:polysaccharide export outer membrane protein
LAQLELPATRQPEVLRQDFSVPSQEPQPARTSLINPTESAGIDEAYILGSGDAIALSFFNVPEYNSQHQIMVDGTINLPLVGNLAIAGMSLKQASEAISARYATELEYPIVTVNLVQPRAFKIALAGEISQPGLYALPAAEGGQFLTVAQAIQAAGGATQAADLKRIEVRRRERTGASQTITVNLLELLQNGDLNPNTTLRDGDTIFIPAANEINLAEANQLAISNLRANNDRPINVAVVGEVASPGPYRLEGTKPTLIQALQVAGGINPSADLRQIRVRRHTRQGNIKEIDIDLWQVLQTGDLSQDLVLQSGDTIKIPTARDMTSEQIASLASSSLSTKVIRVNILGEVKAPGRLELQANTTLNQAILAAGGINRGRGNQNVRLIRFNPNGTVTEQKIKSDLSQAMDPQNNPILENNDAIVVGRSTGAKLTDNLSNVFGIFRWLYPLPFLFSR